MIKRKSSFLFNFQVDFHSILLKNLQTYALLTQYLSKTHKVFFYPARKCSCLSKPRLNIAPKKRILDDLGKLSCISFRPVFFRRILNFCRLCPTPLVILQVAPLAIFVLIPMHLKWSLAALQCSQALHQTRPSPHH